MRIGILTWGSHGDIRPFLALAEGLHGAGHSVHLVITCLEPDTYRHLGTDANASLRISVLAPVVFSAKLEEEVGRLAYTIRNPMTQMAAILRLSFAPGEDAMFAAAQDLCRDADLVIGHYFMHPLQIAAEYAGIPYVSVLLSHAGVPSDYCHPLGIAGTGKLGNRLLWWLTRFALNRTLKHYPNRLRSQLGMAPLRDIVDQVWISRHLTLVAVSPQICARQPDWPATTMSCGFLDMPNNALEGSLPPALTSFLAAGEAPIYMTYGSWMPKDLAGQTKALSVLSQAARQAGCRAIIQSPDAGACGFHSCAQILYVAAAPHKAMFPHCFAVLHHGGAGTTQSATLAGKPSIVVANISEQEHWGRELQRMGIGAKPLKRRSVTARALADRIAHVRKSPHMADKASNVASAMRAENGVARAVEWIGQMRA